jgi:Tfp pilus assembly protein PilN
VKALNLAQRPFRNERLAATAFAIACAILVGLTVWHAVVIRNLLPARTTERHQEVAALEAERRKLSEEAGTLKTETPPAATLAQWNLVKDLVDRRAFSWTGLFARLEQVIPEGVRLTSVSPTVRKGQVELDVDAAVRSREAGWEFVRVLEDGGDFYHVYPKSENGNEFRYGIRYRPQPKSVPLTGPRPAPEEQPVEELEAQAPSPSPAVKIVEGPPEAADEEPLPVRPRPRTMTRRPAPRPQELQ